MAKIRYRLGLDVGANSIGWCVYRLGDDGEPEAIVRLGSRVYPDGRDPKSLASNAAERRQARQARRRRDRLIRRRQRLMAQLVAGGLMPADPEERKRLEGLDPYQLRARGLDQQLSPHELGRALYHLGRRRGFKSSRKERRGADDEKELGKVHAAIQALRERMDQAGVRTVGEYLASQKAQRLPVRGRRAADGGYVLYLQRDMVAEEFDMLWEAQARFHPQLLTETLRNRLKDTILFQRRLLPVLPGRCLFEPDEYRAPLCSPLQQRFRILQELNNLRILDGASERPLTLEERDRLKEELLRSPRLTFAQIRKLLGFGRGSGVRLNLEDGKRKDLKGDFTSTQFSKVLRDRWWGMDEAQQHAVAILVERADDVDELVAALVALPGDLGPAYAAFRPQPHEHGVLDPLAALPAGFNRDEARQLAGINLPEGHGSLSLHALRKIVPELERAVVTYDQAVQAAGYSHHSHFYTGELLPQLPYYGKLLTGYTAPMPRSRVEDERLYGRIPNPTVHIGLNQLRLLVNALIRRFGHPESIVIELAREFGLSGQRRREIQRAQEEAQERNRELDAQLVKLGVRPSRENRQRLMLWEELGKVDPMSRRCVYTGKSISMAMLFSDEVEVDHILPFSKSLHDGIGNKVLCLRQANRDKGNRTPCEAFGHSPPGYDWKQIEERASALPLNKARLFAQDALDAFLEGRNFLDRHLSDTAYFGRAALRYLSGVCPPARIAVSTGRLTSLLRGKWALNELLSGDGSKNRDDYRHHALDAAVVGVLSRSLIQRMATAAARAEQAGENRLLERLDVPWPSFRDDLRRMLAGVYVSHRPDHGTEGPLHNETNYGLVRYEGDIAVVARKVPLESLSKPQDADGIRDPWLREEVKKCLSAGSAKEVKAALLEFATKTGVRRVRKEERLTAIPIHDRRTGEPYRYVKGDGNYCYDIWVDERGRWTGEVISLFEANRKGFDPDAKARPDGTPLRMRLRRNDMVAVEEGDQRRIMRVVRITEGKVTLAEHHEANVDARVRKKEFSCLTKSPNSLRGTRARVVGVDVLGYVNDPGWRP